MILFELQKLLQANADRRLSFSKIWQACVAASLNLPGYPPPEIQRRFANRILSAIDNLEGNLISKHTRGSDRSKLITHVTATLKGVEYLKDVVFTHQERMGRSV